jgi:hypothetical protein
MQQMLRMRVGVPTVHCCRDEDYACRSALRCGAASWHPVSAEAAAHRREERRRNCQAANDQGCAACLPGVMVVQEPPVPPGWGEGGPEGADQGAQVAASGSLTSRSSALLSSQWWRGRGRTPPPGVSAKAGEAVKLSTRVRTREECKGLEWSRGGGWDPSPGSSSTR